MRRNRSIRVLGTMMLLFVVATAAFAFTASNDVPHSNAGFGASDVNGYAVTDINYTISGNELQGVSFTLTPDGAEGVNADFVSVEFSAQDDTVLGTFTSADDCGIDGTAITCTGLGLTLDQVYGMDVAAAQ